MFTLSLEEHIEHLQRMRSARLEYKFKSYGLLSFAFILIFGGLWLMASTGIIIKLMIGFGMAVVVQRGIDALMKYRALDRFVKDSTTLPP